MSQRQCRDGQLAHNLRFKLLRLQMQKHMTSAGFVSFSDARCYGIKGGTQPVTSGHAKWLYQLPVITCAGLLGGGGALPGCPASPLGGGGGGGGGGVPRMLPIPC